MLYYFRSRANRKTVGLEPNSAEHKELQAVRNRRIQQAPETMSKAEMAELTRKANTHLEHSSAGEAYQNLSEAHSIFHLILCAQKKQRPRAKAKELCHTWNKLRSTSHRLSQLNLDAIERMKVIRRAAEYGDRALESAIASQNKDRVAQMQFYRACVKAKRIQLETMDQPFQAPTDLERRKSREAIIEAWDRLQSIRGLEMRLYEPLKTQSLSQLDIYS
jgi:hypothetical protein